MNYTVLDHRNTNEPLFKDTLDALIDNCDWLKANLQSNYRIICNNSFEYPVGSGSAPDDWTVTAYSGNGTAVTEHSTANVCHGAQSLKVTAPASGSGGGVKITQPTTELIPATPNDTLTVKCAIKANGGFATNQAVLSTVRCRLSFYDSDKSFLAAYSEKYDTINLSTYVGTWKTLTFTFAPADFTSASMCYVLFELQLGASSGLTLTAGDTMFVDRLSIR